MQDAKMERFLKSININNIDDFDMSFDLVKRDILNPEIWILRIIKDTPWTYDLLRQFQDALINITYQYNLQFSYRVKIKAANAYNLFFDWYQTINRFPCSFDVRLNDEKNKLEFIYTGLEVEKGEIQNTIDDFKDFLNFFGYDDVGLEIVEELPEHAIISKRKLNKIIKAADEIAEETIQTEESEEIFKIINCVLNFTFFDF